MSSALNNIVLIGGGGRIGQIILRGLLTAPHFTITALKRPGSSSTFPTALNLTVKETDFSPDSLATIFKGQDAVISVVGGTGFADQKPYIDAAVKAGVKRFFPSEFGINGQSKAVQELTPFFAVKQEVLDYLVEKEKDGLTWTGLIVGVLFDWCLVDGFLGFNLTTNTAEIWDDGNTKWSGVNEADLGKAVVSCLEHPAETANRFVYVSSVASTQGEVLAALEKATSAKWTINRKSTQARLDEAREALGKGDMSGAFTMVKTSCWGNIPGLQQHFEVDEKERLANELLGIESASVQETVDRVLASGNITGSQV